MDDHCPGCGVKLTRCLACDSPIPRMKNNSAYCDQECKGMAMKLRYNHLVSLGYTYPQAHKGRSAGTYARMVKAKESEQCNTNASGHPGTPTSDSLSPSR